MVNPPWNGQGMAPSDTGFVRGRIVPARTNEFQQIVKYIYDQISPGATVTESAFLKERDGTLREVDILIEWKFAGTDLQMAVECRDYTRDQNIEWLDQLIGKYRDLRVDKIVAVSSSKFRPAAKRKAKEHGIEAITVNEALTKDWKAEIERWQFMTHSFTLMRIATIRANGETYTYTDISPDGNTATHRDKESEFMHNVLKPFFMERLSQQVGQMLEAKIAENWQSYFADSTPRWAEIVVASPGLMKDGQPLDVEKIVFGVGTFFHIGQADKQFALREHALSDVAIKTMKDDFKLRLVFDKEARPVSIDFGDRRIVHGPFSNGFHTYEFPRRKDS
jgi:hypothetical protein